MSEQRAVEVAALRQLVTACIDAGYGCRIYERTTSNYAVLFVKHVEASGLVRGPIGWRIWLAQAVIKLERLGNPAVHATAPDVDSIGLSIQAAEADLSRSLWPQKLDRHVVDVRPYPL